MLLNTAMANKKDSAQDANEHAPDFRASLHNIAKHKDRDSFITLFQHFAPRVKSFLIKAGLTPEIADEIAQETMLTVWNKAESYNPKAAAPSTWIFTIARNKRIDHLRKTNRYQTANDDKLITLEDNAPGPADHLSHNEETTRIAKAIETLPEEQATLIRKSFFEDKSHTAIAEETGVPLGTIKSRIRLALKRLKKETGVKELWN